MPIYEYECTKCGHQTEVWQKFSDPPATRCEQCNGKLKKLISQSTFHLKGTGWYVTDYASKPGSDREKGNKSHKKDTETKGAKNSTEKSKKDGAPAGGTKSEG